VLLRLNLLVEEEVGTKERREVEAGETTHRSQLFLLVARARSGTSVTRRIMTGEKEVI
jgi:hypothetical protein